MVAGDASTTLATPDRTLADAYADRHERLDNFVFMYAIPSRLMARLGIELTRLEVTRSFSSRSSSGSWRPPWSSPP